MATETVTKNSYVLSDEDKEFLDSVAVWINSKNMTLEEFVEEIGGYKINGKSLSSNMVLKSEDFSEAKTGEKMLAGLTYTVVSTW